MRVYNDESFPPELPLPLEMIDVGVAMVMKWHSCESQIAFFFWKRKNFSRRRGQTRDEFFSAWATCKHIRGVWLKIYSAFIAMSRHGMASPTAGVEWRCTGGKFQITLSRTCAIVEWSNFVGITLTLFHPTTTPKKLTSRKSLPLFHGKANRQ